MELRVDLPEDVTVDDLATVFDTETDYPVHRPFTEISGSFNVDPSGLSTRASHAITGYVWHTPDESRHIQARRDVFLYLQRAPYSHWEDFVGEAERLWLRYRDTARPNQVTRVGARFVNRIDIPLPAVELTDYLTVTAQVPAALPQIVAGYFINMELPEVRPGVACRVISTVIAPMAPDTTSVVLDIDAWGVPSAYPNSKDFDGAVTTLLGELRRAKNEVFEACITDHTRRLFL